MNDLETELQMFTGSENLYRHWTGLLHYTDGIKFLAEKANAYWLIDLIASWQIKVKDIPFQVWDLKKVNNTSAVITMREDKDEPAVVVQKLPYTDFPLKYIKLYVVNGVLMLPSEY